jgi:hypothetical protein
MNSEKLHRLGNGVFPEARFALGRNPGYTDTGQFFSKEHANSIRNQPRTSHQLRYHHHYAKL